MSQQGWQETLISAQIDGTALTASTTATSIIPPAARYTLPSNYFEIGKTLRVTATGRISTVTTPGTLTLDIRLGTVAAPIVVWNAGAMLLNAAAKTNDTWLFDCVLTCRAIGAGTSANLIGVGQFISRATLASVAVASGGILISPLPDTAPAVGTGFDSTISNVIDFFAKWSISNADSIQVHQYMVESLN